MQTKHKNRHTLYSPNADINVALEPGLGDLALVANLQQVDGAHLHIVAQHVQLVRGRHVLVKHLVQQVGFGGGSLSGRS